MASKEVVYRTRDSLKNFYIKVELRKLTLSGGGGNLLLETGQHLASRASTGGQDSEIWVFRWQEKVFSQKMIESEEELYADANNCTTALEDKYHRDILALRHEGGRPNSRLFSYVDNDCFHPVEEVGHQLTDSGVEDRTFPSQYSSSVRRRHISRKTESGVPVSRQTPVSEKPSGDERLTHRIITPPTQSMYLMTDLRRMDSRDPADEHVLCLITVNSHGVVTISPDFNRNQPAYRIENRHREVFEYRLEHASEPISLEERAKEQRILSELYGRHASYLNSCVGSNFSDLPESDALRVILLGEIVSAYGFEYDDLYVTAHLELPEFWQVESDHDESLSVVTQISRTKSRHKCNIAYFSCPFEYELLYNNPTLTEDRLPEWPRILLEVSSLDCWDRHRIEGYGYTALPNRAGIYDLCVHTWRPSGIRILDKMKRFFVGGAPQIEDISYVAHPQDFEGTHLSKYGFRTESSGTVKLRLNVIHHSRIISERLQSRELAYALKYKGFKVSVAAAIDAFQQAKQRAAATLK